MNECQQITETIYVWLLYFYRRKTTQSRCPRLISIQSAASSRSQGEESAKVDADSTHDRASGRPVSRVAAAVAAKSAAALALAGPSAAHNRLPGSCSPGNQGRRAAGGTCDDGAGTVPAALLHCDAASVAAYGASFCPTSKAQLPLHHPAPTALVHLHPPPRKNFRLPLLNYCCWYRCAEPSLARCPPLARNSRWSQCLPQSPLHSSYLQGRSSLCANICEVWTSNL